MYQERPSTGGNGPALPKLSLAIGTNSVKNDGNKLKKGLGEPVLAVLIRSKPIQIQTSPVWSRNGCQPPKMDQFSQSFSKTAVTL